MNRVVELGRRVGCICLLGILMVIVLPSCSPNHDTALFQEKIDLLAAEVLTEDIRWELGEHPAGSVGHAVFMSVCDPQSRASVYTGTGESLDAAWEAAVAASKSALEKSGLQPVWVKADIVYLSKSVSMEDLYETLGDTRNGFFQYGVSFDKAYETALLEAELNGNEIYDYRAGSINLENLNRYLGEADRAKLNTLPEACAIFQTFSRFCDEENVVHTIEASGHGYGHRSVNLVDAVCAENVVTTAADYLEAQIKEDGAFIYGYYPKHNNEIESYNILRHAGSVWSLVRRYRMTGDAELADGIERAIEYMLDRVVYFDEDTAYLYEETDDEIKLGGCGIAIVALTEYMDAFNTDKHLDVCRKLGNGILSLMDQEEGTYYHVLNGDFSEKEAFRTVYYDGEATFALCRLYGMTGEQGWLDAAKAAVDHFIAADYIQYGDQWVAYAMNEISKHVKSSEYYTFALRNVQENCEKNSHGITSPVVLELLLTTFELYDKMVQRGGTAAGFETEAFLKAIYNCAEQGLDEYFYPEVAMYMEKPRAIWGAFMVREDSCRVRIDDVQNNIGGYYLYHENYEKLVEYGMLECI